MRRNERLAEIRKLDGRHIPVLIIGGGINGAGVFRDLAFNDTECLIIDKSDFCSGSSAAPSRLIHGGLRYLENGEFRLVSESTRERNLLLKNASHVVKPLRTTVPITTWMSGLLPAALRFLHLSNAAGARGAGIVKAGLLIYDWLGRREKVMPNHYMMGKQASLGQLPLLRDDIVATATYYDALVTHPERLCFEVISDGLSENPSCQAFNYISVSGQKDGKIQLFDEVSGTTVSITTDIICNAAGPWIDKVNARLGRDTAYIGGSKGSHVVLDNEPLRRSLDGRMIYFETNDGRICLTYPIGDKVLLGTTDLRIDDPDEARCEDIEIDYLFEALRNVMPAIAVSRDQIVFRYSGVRPLPNSDQAAVGRVSRDHAIEVDEPDETLAIPVFSLVGGKWTTFRAFAENAVDQILPHLKRERLASTENLGIGGGKAVSDASEPAETINKIAATYGIEKAVVEKLYTKFGNVPDLYTNVALQGGQQPLASIDGYFVGEISYLADFEQVVHLTDLLLRRTTIALNGLITRPALEELAGIVGSVLDWDDEQRQAEIENAQAELSNVNGVVIASNTTPENAPD